MLSVYTRHYPPCAQTDPYYRRCHCSKWITGIVETTGAFVRISAPPAPGSGRKRRLA